MDSTENTAIQAKIVDGYDEDDFVESLKQSLNDTNPINVEKIDKSEFVDFVIDKAASLISLRFFNSGLYQFISFLLIGIAWTVGNGWYVFVSVFSAYSPNFKCVKNQNLTTAENHTIDECFVWNLYSNKSETKCEKWTYDRTQMKSTLITEYNFVCDKAHYFEVTYTCEQLGYLFGALIFSYLADKVGRKPVFSGVLISMAVLGFIQYWVENFFIYMAIGFFINLNASGLDSVCVPLVLEMFTTKKRTTYGMGMTYIWVIVLIFLSPLAYLVKTWRELRLYIFFALAIIGISSLFLVQESITWLISTMRLNEAMHVIERIARFNRLNGLTKFKAKKVMLIKLFEKLSLVDCKQSLTNVGKKSGNIMSTSVVSMDINNRRSSFYEAIKNKKFLSYVIIMFINWFVGGLVYDGLLYLNASIGENIFINWILMTSIELPAQIACHYLISKYGRRIVTCVSLIATGIFLFSTVSNYLNLFKLDSVAQLALFVCAKFSITIGYSTIILHSTEVYPTNIRSFGYGVCLASAKISSLVSPMISLYLAKIHKEMPSIIYGIVSILCGFLCLNLPESRNHCLPNSVEEVLKWNEKKPKNDQGKNIVN